MLVLLPIVEIPPEDAKIIEINLDLREIEWIEFIHLHCSFLFALKLRANLFHDPLNFVQTAELFEAVNCCCYTS